LDGQGADELMGGYLFYLPHALSGFGIMAALRQYTKLVKVHPFKIVNGAALIATLARLPAMIGRSILPARHFQRMQNLIDGLNSSLLTDSTKSLANLIHYADATSMAFSVESRMPFLDIRLSNFLMNLPEAYKINDGWTKYLARKAFAGKLSDRIVWRKDKKGWPIPEQLWSEGPLHQWFQDQLSKERIDNAPFLHKELAALAQSQSVASRVRAMNFLTWWEIFGTGDWRKMSDM
jgi:asparagine synthase (glutamine-hydrolysing)